MLHAAVIPSQTTVATLQTTAATLNSPLELHTLARACGIPLGLYRRGHVDACIERAVARTGVENPRELAETLRGNARARTAFRRSVLVPVSGLFRDPEQFDVLERTILPELAARRPRVSVWSAGCSNGSELYSVGIVLERQGMLAGSRLVGTDVLTEELEVAAKGVYHHAEMSAGLRAAMRWEQLDLITDPAPAGVFELVLCRNVTIYLDPLARSVVHAKLASALRRGGYLVLGRSETLTRPEQFELEPHSPHVFRRAAR
jgi:chemotaxis protein methyltransferase CheR